MSIKVPTLVVCCAIALLAATAAGAATQPAFNLSLTTDRGCRENGDDPVYVVGEAISVTFRVGSATAGSASTVLYAVFPNGTVVATQFGQIATNQTRTLVGRVGAPSGVHRLILQADAAGYQRTQRTCSFRVVSASPPAGTPTRTRTPTVAPPTATPGGAVRADIRTNRGCLENGDDPVFVIGERIRVTFRVDSASRSFAQVAIRDRLANGQVKVLSFGSLPTNTSFLFTAAVGPPTGTESLELRAQAAGLPLATDTCSFRVVSGPGTSTRTATATRPRTSTPTRPAVTQTPTATPLPADCVGACSTPGVVSVQDLVTVIKIAAGELPVSACPEADADGGGAVSLSEVLLAVTNAINGCDAP